MISKFKKLSAKILSLALAAVMMISCVPIASAEDNRFTEGVWTYTVENNEAIINDFDAHTASGDIEVPATLGGYPVTTIGTLAFEGSIFVSDDGWDDINSITISNNVTTIKNMAFSMCRGLDYVEFGDSVTEIGGNIFDCCSIKNLIIGKNITEIGIHSYSYLQNYIVSENNKYYSSEDGVVFSKDKTELIAYPGNNERTSYRIPDRVTKINGGAFNFHTGYNLETLIIPTSVKTIEENIFFDSSVSQIFYEGSEEQWNNIDISSENDHLFNFAELTFNYKAPAKTGDISGDNKINSNDALFVLQAATGKLTLTEAQKELADVNKDTKINSSDALAILQYATGLITKF